MTTNLSRETLIILHTLLGTWDRYPFGVHYCDVCDALYDWWLGCDGLRTFTCNLSCDGRGCAAMIVERTGDLFTSECAALAMA